MFKEDRPLFVALMAIAFSLFLNWAASPSLPSQPADPKTDYEQHWYAPLSDLWDWLAKDSISLFTGVLAVLTGVAVFYNGRQIKLARDDFNVTHRPWIAIDVKAGENGLHFDDGTMFLHLDIICHNVGNSPARDVSVHVKQHILQRAKDMNDPKGRDEILAALNKFGTEIDSPPYDYKDRVQVIFPGKEIRDYGDRGQFWKQLLDRLSGGKPFVRLYVLGIVDYKFTFGEPVRHQTRFAYHVGRITPGVACKIEEVEIGRNLAQNEVMLDDMLLGEAFSAD